MNKIDFKNTKPDFESGEFKWYLDKDLNHRINNSQALNLPKLSGLCCFVVVGNSSSEYVIINDRQEALNSYNYSFDGFNQMEAFINILKISKHYDEDAVK